MEARNRHCPQWQGAMWDTSGACGLLVPDFDHGDLGRALGALHDRLLADALSEQRLRERRGDADLARGEVDLVGPDDAVGHLLAVFVLDGEPGTEEDAV